MGKRALEGLNGVLHVSKGFKGFKETNTAVYDPEKITIEEMINALKSAKTFIGVAED